ncbi:MAG: Holliday junction resolvase RuvX [Burkholderia sp.]|nr:Holliday junction resolvase RuvX [Burkholderia sp.]
MHEDSKKSALYTILIGFDYGEKRIGVAIGNTLTYSARSLVVIRNLSRYYRFKSVSKILTEWCPDGLIVGLPTYPDGIQNKITYQAKRFGNQLNGRFKLPVIWVDERYSSSEVKANIKESRYNFSFVQNMLDADAACVILQQYLNQVFNMKLSKDNALHK